MSTRNWMAPVCTLCTKGLHTRTQGVIFQGRCVQCNLSELTNTFVQFCSYSLYFVHISIFSNFPHWRMSCGAECELKLDLGSPSPPFSWYRTRPLQGGTVFQTAPTLSDVDGGEAERHTSYNDSYSLSLDMKNKGPHTLPRTSFFVSLSSEFICIEYS